MDGNSAHEGGDSSDLSSVTWRGKPIRSICCIGAGYVGGPTSAVLAVKLPNVKVTVVDLNQSRIDAWNSSRLPIYEPNLTDMVYAARDGLSGLRTPNLVFTTDVDQAIAQADLVFVSVNTPAKVFGLGAGSATDLGFVESATRRIAQVSTTDKIVIEKSTVPCRTADSIRDILAANGRPGVHFDVLSNPEFLAEGTAVTNLTDPDRILIGSLPDAAGAEAAHALLSLYAVWVPRERIVTMNLWSSELAKLAANALLAQRISSINSLSAICEATGADISEVSYAVGLDNRIGPKMLKSSVGFGGSCFKKDVLSLVYLADSLHLPEVAAYWRSVVDINEWQKERFTTRIIHSLYNTLAGKKIAIFGFAYKKNTGDTRGSAAISVVNRLVAERAQVAIYDPQVREEQIWHDLHVARESATDLPEHVTVCKDPYSACLDAHAVVIITEWDEFRVDSNPGLDAPLLDGAPVDHAAAAGATQPSASRSKSVDWHRIASKMQRPMFVFDGRGIIEPAGLEALGFRVECIGNAHGR